MAAWTIDRESVSFDFLEGEVVAIHLGTGIYYSLRGAAATLWQALETPSEPAGIVAALSEAYDAAPGALEADVRAFLERLQMEQLIVEKSSAGSVPQAALAIKAPYAPPVLERFSDLQDLLLLDPIHDVGAEGWPHRLRPKQ